MLVTAHQHWLAQRLNIGTITGPATPVSGGFHHRMWRMHTSSGDYAVKQLAADTDLTDPGVCRHFSVSEAVAAAFADRGIPALAALPAASDYLQLHEGEGYLVYPWTDARARARDAITADHIDVVAAIMASLHGARLEIPGVDAGTAAPMSVESLTLHVELARKRNVRDADYLFERLDDLLDIVRRLDAARTTLSTNRVISHGDLDHKNVLWDEQDKALLIDWESARHINPSYEVLLEALDWSGITAHFEIAPFERFLTRYTRAGGRLDADSIPAAFNAILGAWVNWMMYNVGRALGVEDARQRALGSEQVDLALSTLLRLERQVPRLSQLAQAYAQ